MVEYINELLKEIHGEISKAAHASTLCEINGEISRPRGISRAI